MANNKRTVQDLAESMAKRHRYSKVKSESFIRGALSIIKGALEKENYVKVKGLGTFKLVTVNSRESVNVNTGERIEISEHQRLTFTPDKSLKERVNRPFEQFQTVVIEDDDLDLNHLHIDDILDVTPQPDDDKVVSLVSDEEQSVEEENDCSSKVTSVPISNDEDTVSLSAEEKNNVTDSAEFVRSETSGTGKSRCWLHGLLWGLLTLLLMVLSYFAGHDRWFNFTTKTANCAPMPAVAADSADIAVTESDSLDTQMQDTVKKVQSQVDESPEALSQHYDQLPNGRFLIIGTLAEHKVEPGESLTRISKKYFYSNAEDYVPYIIFYNRLKSADVVHKGTVLKIPKLAHKL